MKTKTYPSIVKKVVSAVGHSVSHHPKTAENPLGQSGLHTLVDDIISVVMSSHTEAEAYKRLGEYFYVGSVEIDQT